MDINKRLSDYYRNEIKRAGPAPAMPPDFAETPDKGAFERRRLQSRRHPSVARLRPGGKSRTDGILAAAAAILLFAVGIGEWEMSPPPWAVDASRQRLHIYEVNKTVNSALELAAEAWQSRVIKRSNKK